MLFERIYESGLRETHECGDACTLPTQRVQGLEYW